jgi:hypothetical protein
MEYIEIFDLYSIHGDVLNLTNSTKLFKSLNRREYLYKYDFLPYMGLKEGICSFMYDKNHDSCLYIPYDKRLKLSDLKNFYKGYIVISVLGDFQLERKQKINEYGGYIDSGDDINHFITRRYLKVVGVKDEKLSGVCYAKLSLTSDIIKAPDLYNFKQGDLFYKIEKIYKGA